MTDFVTLNLFQGLKPEMLKRVQHDEICYTYLPTYLRYQFRCWARKPNLQLTSLYSYAKNSSFLYGGRNQFLLTYLRTYFLTENP